MTGEGTSSAGETVHGSEPGSGCSPVDAATTQEALDAACSELDQILEAATSGMCVIDTGYRVMRVNQALLSLAGTTAEEVQGRGCHEVLSCTLCNTPDCPLQQIVSGESGIERETVIERADGTKITCTLTSTPLRNPDGQVVGVIADFREITEQRILQSQLLQAQKLEAIGQLAAGIAHEINTPIQYVGDNTVFLRDSFSELLGVLQKYAEAFEAGKRQTLSEDLAKEVDLLVEEADLEFLREEIPKAIEQSLEGVERVANIVRAMKEFSHPGEDERTAIDINHAIETTITVARNEWKYVAEMQTDLDSELPAVPCFPGELNQVILNLLVNAAHAIETVVGDGSQSKGTITVSTRGNGDWVEVRVADTGAGIPEEVQTRIFDPFFTTKEVGKGTGQGLSVAYSVIAEKHGGTIAFETEIGKGTTFIIRLPMHPEGKCAIGAEDEKQDHLR